MDLLVEFEVIVCGWEIEPSFLSDLGAHCIEHQTIDNVIQINIKQPFSTHPGVVEWQINSAQRTL
jgi:hypothetical protein